MRLTNQYSAYIEQYKIENGIDPFIRYKSFDCSDEEKQKLEDWLFSIMRSVNEVPRTLVSDIDIQKDLIALSEIDSHEVYHDNSYWFNLSGNTTLRDFFWDKMNDVSKEGKPSVNQQFHNDYQLKRVIKKALSYSSNEMSLFNWIQINGSGYGNSFRPASAKAIYELFGKDNCRVLDSSAGYGARMLGAHFASNVIEYFAVDPNTADDCKRLSDYLDMNQFNTNTKKTILKIGSEDLPVEEYYEYFDLYFTSPPYFDTERYSEDETQSYKKFPKYSLWVQEFYGKTIHNVCKMLKKDGIFILNIFEKIPEIKNLTKLFLADCGWYIFQSDKYMLRTLPGSNHKVDNEGNPIIRDRTVGMNFEAVWYAKHYNQLLKEGLITEEQAKQFKERSCFE